MAVEKLASNKRFESCGSPTGEKMGDGGVDFYGVWIPRWVLFTLAAVGIYLGYLILLNLPLIGILVP